MVLSVCDFPHPGGTHSNTGLNEPNQSAPLDLGQMFKRKYCHEGKTEEKHILKLDGNDLMGPGPISHEKF